MTRPHYRLLRPIRLETLESRETPAMVLWTAGGGNLLWSNPLNWTVGGVNKVPAPGDDVKIDKGTSVTFDSGAGSITLNTLDCNLPFTMQAGILASNNGESFAKAVTQTGGIFGGKGAITFAAGLNMTGGGMQGPGNTTFTPGSIWTINGSSTSITLNNRTIDTFGPIAWIGSLPVQTNDGLVIVHGGGTFLCQTTAPWLFNTSGGGVTGTPIIIELGAIMQVMAPTTIQGAVNVAGTLQVNQPLSLLAGGNLSGTTTGTGAITLINGTYTFIDNAAPGNTGGYVVNGGSLLVSDPNDSVTLTKLTQNAGTVGGLGKLALNAWTWNGGVMKDAGQTTLLKGATGAFNSLNNGLTLNSRVVLNNGAIVWTGNQPIQAGGSDWTNASGSSFEVQGNGAWTNGPGPAPHSFTNPVGATFKKTIGTGFVDFQVPFFNTGTIQVDSGTLNLQGGLNGNPSSLGKGTYVLTGVLQAPGLAVMNNAANLTIFGPSAALVNSTVGMSALSNLTANSGTLNIVGATTVTVNSTFVNSGVVTIGQGARFNVAGDYTQSTGTTTINGTLDPLTQGGAFKLQGGTLKGNGHLLSKLTQTGGKVAPGNSPGILTIEGDYFQFGGLEFEIAGLNPGTAYDRLEVTGNLFLGGAIDFVRTYAPAIGVQFLILDNQGPNPISGTLLDLSQGDIFNADGMLFQIDYMGGSGNDVVITRVVTTLDTVEIGTPGNCSTIRSITVNFKGLVNLPATPSSAFSLQRTVGGAPVGSVSVSVDTSASTVDQTIAKLTFPGGANTEFKGLTDSRYRLTVLGGMITDPAGAKVDAGHTGLPGSNSTNDFYRLYGDIDCDGDVDGADFLQFRVSFLSPTPNPACDIEGDGDVDGADFLRFRVNFLHPPLP